MVDRVLDLPEGTRLYLLAPVVRGRKGEYRKELAEYLKKGFQRVKIDGTFYELAEAPVLDKKFPHDIDVVVDRIVVRPDIGQRLAESFETALKLAEGLAVIEYADAPAAHPSSFETRPAGAPSVSAERSSGDEDGADDRRRQSEVLPLVLRRRKAPSRRMRPPARRSRKSTTRAGRNVSCFPKSSPARFPASPFRKSSPRLFSFNNPYGACPACGGLGVEQHIDEDLVIPDKELTLRKGAIAPWAKSSSPYYIQTLTALGKFYKFTLDTKWKDLPKKTQRRDAARLRRRRNQVLL